jgi:hypothetical protein
MFGSLPDDVSQSEQTTGFFGHSQEHHNSQEDDFVQDGGDEADTFYNAVKPSFQLMCNFLEGNYTSEDIVMVKEVFDKVQANAQTRRMAQMGGTLHGTYVSSQAAAPRRNFSRRKLGKRSGPNPGR